MRPAIRVVVLISIAVAVGQAKAFPRPNDVSISVVAVDGGSRAAVAGADVFVLGEDGKRLAMAKTDSNGQAILALSLAKGVPQYVLVDHPHYFVSGLRWDDRLREYYVMMQILTVR
jgi:hypothetical protein